MMRAALERLTDFALPILRLFVWVNVVGVGGDVYLAHLINDYEHWAEWIPIGFSATAGVLLLPWLLRGRFGRWVDGLGLAVLGTSVLVGVLGMYYHVQNGYLMGLNLRRLVYSAPLLAPLAYTGIGCVGLVSRAEQWLGLKRRQWLLILTAGGFLANGALSAIDHAQNGFYYAPEWISVVTALVAGFCLLFVSVRDRLSGLENTVLIGLLALQVVVGLAGAALHVSANLQSAHRVGLVAGFVFGAPAMAPLLFVDVALLGLIALLFPEPLGETPSELAPESEPAG